MSTAPIRILSCSPRAHGNSDTMATLFAEGAKQAGLDAEIRYLRDYSVIPCTGCHLCATHPEHACYLAKRDQVEDIFDFMQGASAFFLTAPIFFYHVPAQLKALMDRSQRHWTYKGPQASGSDLENTRKAVYVGLIAARPRGENLFTGTLLSFKYFFDLFDSEMRDPYLLKGYDGPKELREDGEACAQLRAFGATVAEKHRPTGC